MLTELNQKFIKWYYLNINIKNTLIYKQLTLKEYLKKKNFEIYNNLIYSLLKILGFYIQEIKLINNELVIIIKDKIALFIIINFFKNNYKYQLKELIDICVVDYFKKQKRFEINYLLLSIKYKYRLRIKLYCAEQEYIPSITAYFSSAQWLERENWDMFGIFFINNTDLRRILTDYGFEGFPFRKDFPISGYIELRYDDTKHIVLYEKLELTQEFRFFEFTSPWDWNK